MLSSIFKHSCWKLNGTITVKEFLDYVLMHSGDFTIKQKNKPTDLLLNKPDIEFYLTDRRYSYKLGFQERNYLAQHDPHFASLLPPFQENYMCAIIAASNEQMPSAIPSL